MWTPEYYIAAIMLICLCLYLLTGGADFGGGILDLLCFGPRAPAQRELIAHRLAPIWESNHVWLILIVVLMFVCFPSVFETVSIFLNIPLTIMLVGITLRGSAFVFRSHDIDTTSVQRRWSLLFAVGSIITPLMLGICLGAVASGALNNPAKLDFITPWLARFPVLVGFLTLWLCGFLASLYLIQHVESSELKQDFRIRAFGFAVLIGCTAFAALFVAEIDAPLIHQQLIHQTWSPLFQAFTGAAALTALLALWFKQDILALLAGIFQTICLLSGWALAQFPYMIVDSHTILNSAAPHAILNPVLIALAAGSIALVPSYLWLYWVFRPNAPKEPALPVHNHNP